MFGSPLAFFGTVPDGYAGHCARSPGATVTTHAITDIKRTTRFIKPPWREPAYYARHEPTDVAGNRGCFGAAGFDDARRRTSFVRSGVRRQPTAHGERHRRPA